MIDCQKITDCANEEYEPRRTLKDPKGTSKSKYLIDNPSRSSYQVIDIENCVFSNEPHGKRCDYAMIAENNVYFIELKGSDWKMGVEQLLNTIQRLKHCFNSMNNINARLILSKSPAVRVRNGDENYRKLNKLTREKIIFGTDEYTELI